MGSGVRIPVNEYSCFLTNLWFLLAELQTVCNQYWQRICSLEGDKFDLERQNNLKDLEVSSTRYSFTEHAFIFCSIFFFSFIFNFF